MNTNDIMTIRKVCENGSVTKSAAQLYMTPQAISVVIKRVESELGVNLFQRSPGGMVQNEYGKLFYKKSNDLVKALTELEELFRLDIHNQHGVLRVAFSQGIIMMLGISYILEFSRFYPNFRIELIEGPDKKIEDLVSTGAVDFGVSVSPFISNDFNSIPWCAFRCCAVMRNDHEVEGCFEEQSTISIAELKDRPIVLENKDFSIYREFKRICKEECGYEPNIYFETVEIENALTIAADGFATAVVPLPVAMNAQNENIRIAGIREELLWDWHFIRRKDKPVTDIERKFINYLIKKSEKMGWT